MLQITSYLGYKRDNHTYKLWGSRKKKGDLIAESEETDTASCHLFFWKLSQN